MITLAFEFSSPRRSVAVLDCDHRKKQSLVLGSSSDEGLRTIQPLQLVEKALAAACLEREAVETLVVGLGPGSYTGIRSAIAMAQGWQLGRAVRLLGISSVECLVAQTHAQQWLGRAHIIIDAQRNELYWAVFGIHSSGWEEIQPLRLAAIEEVRQTVMRDQTAQASTTKHSTESPAAAAVVIGPEATRWFPEGCPLALEAATLGRLALGRTDFVKGEALQPIYLRETNFVKAAVPSRTAGLE
jgi:tRNA threonylcarbamoyladenosine biosynthesis protein TsaB